MEQAVGSARCDAAYGVAQGVLGVDAGGPGLGDERQQPVTEIRGVRDAQRRAGPLGPVEDLVGEQQGRQAGWQAVEDRGAGLLRLP